MGAVTRMETNNTQRHHHEVIIWWKHVDIVLDFQLHTGIPEERTKNYTQNGVQRHASTRKNQKL